MIKPIEMEGHEGEIILPGDLGQNWLSAYTQDFQRRMITLLGYEFRSLSCRLAYQLVNSHRQKFEVEERSNVTICCELIEPYLNRFDLKRLESYSRNMVDFHLIMDLVPTIARLYFNPGNVLPAGLFTLSPVQAALLTGIGLQFKSIDDLTVDLNLPANQLLAMFNKAMNKITALVRQSYEQEIEKELVAEEKQSKQLLKGLNADSAQTNENDNMEDVELVKKMQREKAKFIEKHAISSHHKKQLEDSQTKLLLDRVSLPRKRSADSGSEDLEELVAKDTKKSKKDKSNKRKRTK